MNWIVYALACVFLYGIMQFFMKFASGNPVASSVVFIAAQFTAQVLLGAYFISKSGFGINYDGVKYGVAGASLQEFPRSCSFLRCSRRLSLRSGQSLT